MEEVNSRFKDVMVFPNLSKLHHHDTNDLTTKQYSDSKDKDKKQTTIHKNNNNNNNNEGNNQSKSSFSKRRDCMTSSLPLNYNKSMSELFSIDQATDKVSLLNSIRKLDAPIPNVNDSYSFIRNKFDENVNLKNYPTSNEPPKYLMSLGINSNNNKIINKNNMKSRINNFNNKSNGDITNINPAYKSILLNNKQKMSTYPLTVKTNSQCRFGSSTKLDAYQGLVTRERFEILKVKAQNALSEGKTFSIVNNVNGACSVRRSLLRRGWVERYSTAEDRGTAHEHFLHAPDRESMIMSKFLKNKPVRFIWGDNFLNWNLINPNTIVNRFPAAGKSLSTKTGLLTHLEQQVWTIDDGRSMVKYPRTFSIYDEADLNYFASQYRITACVNMLKKFCFGMLEGKPIVSENGTVCIKNIDFAIERVCEYVGVFEHAYVDLWNYSIVSDSDWDNFICEYYQFAHHNRQIKNTENYEIDKLITSAEACIDKMRLYWPEVDYEGYENVWIVKPAAQSCGRGIVILKQLKDIVAQCAKRQPSIVQKYIEKPCLVYNTKVDIRQWFLVTRSSPMRIYMYAKCYLRFCSKEFSLSNLHESVHLSNNSIQYKYENIKKSNSKLPRQNMWSSDTYQEYLRSRGQLDKWTNIVIPGMRRCIIGAMLAAQDSMSDRPNSFNLYGADFLLTEEYTPLLIEINSCPAMKSTTDVTGRLCPMVLDDTIQVMTCGNPRPTNNIGNFQLIYDQVMNFDVPSITLEKHPDLVIISKKARINTLPRDSNKNQLTEPLVDYDKKHSHWEDRSLKYDDLSWYKTKKLALTIVPTLDLKLSYSWPKHPGEVTPVNEISYVTKPVNNRPVVSKWMESCRQWIASRLNKEDNNTTQNAKQQEPPRNNNG